MARQGGWEGEREEHVDRQASELFLWLDCNQTPHRIAVSQTGARCIRKATHTHIVTRLFSFHSVPRPPLSNKLCFIKRDSRPLNTVHPHIQGRFALNSFHLRQHECDDALRRMEALASARVYAAVARLSGS